MRIGIDAHFASYELRGIGKYVVQLVTGLVRSGGAHEYIVYGDAGMFPQPNGHGNVTFRRPGALPYPVWEQVVLPQWIRQDRLELLHCPANTAPLGLPKDLKLVVTIHDVMYLLPNRVLPPSRVVRQQFGRLYRKFVVPSVARRADRIIADSEFTKQEVVDYLKVLPDRIRAVHLGIDAQFASLADKIDATPKEIGAQEVDAPYILALGAGDSRKNTLAVIRAYSARWRELPSQERLVIVGLRDSQTSAANELVRQLGLSERVFFAGYVSEESLAWFYKSARCFLYPTLYEGFGLPPLEAMTCGTPVITSDCTSVPEVARGAAILVDPTSDQSIGDALVRLLQDEPLRRRLIRQGKAQVRKFRWQETVRKTLAVYEELSEGANPRALAAGAN